MDIIDRARKYLAAAPPAISGSGGHNQTYSVAVALVHGFELDTSTARQLLGEYNSRCQPPWTDSDLDHKIKSAQCTPHDKPRGHLKGVSYKYSGGESSAPLAVTLPPKEVKAAPVKRYNLDSKCEVPQPMMDPCRQFIMSAFQPGEGISIERATLNDEKKEIPEGKGLVLTREQWLSKLAAVDYDPNKIWRSTDKTGVFIRVNPTSGSLDKEVTAFRHALVEFDHISIPEQWSLIKQSNIPCAAVLHSGGKSLHAWVRVDAKDWNEWKQRVQVLYSHFEPYGVDIKNKNPSRFSRLPGMTRGAGQQALLALNNGSESFSSWLIERDKKDLPQPKDLRELSVFISEADPNSLLGNRWLCKSGAAMIIAQSGVGKSSLLMQMAILFALGKPVFGIKPARPLKSVIIQAENDDGDMAEMFQGVISGMNLATTVDELNELVNHLQTMVLIFDDTTHAGATFAEYVKEIIEAHRPDLVMADPMLAYIGDDVNSQKVCSQFFRGLINPISKATGVAWLWFHHTGKPEKDSKMRKNWTSNDYGYIGAGSAELTNFARATIYLKQNKEDEKLFEMILGKRGMRAGATDIQGNKTNRIWMRHGDFGICWKQVNEPEESSEEKEKKKGAGRPSKPFDYDGFLNGISGEHFNAKQIIEKIQDAADCGESTAKKHWKEIKPKMVFDAEFDTFSFQKTEGQK
jgi:RecA-family ATPase